MNLQRKFMVLLGLFGLTVAIGLGVAFAFGNLLARELVTPFQSTTTLLLKLSALKHTTGEQTRMLPGPRRDEPGAEYVTPSRNPESQSGVPGAHESVDPGTLSDVWKRYAEVRARRDLELEALVSDPLFGERIGASTARGLREQTEEARSLADRWFQTGDIATGIRAGEAHFLLHEIIERAEAKVLEDAKASLAFGESLQRSHNIVIISGVVAAGLMIVLGTLLVRRWISRPVERLRVAAERIAAGDYAHRVTVETSDELGQLGNEVNEMAALVAKTQADAVERARLASTGEMVRRLAHNIRNPLAGIRGLAELTIKRLPANETVREDQAQIVQTVDRFNNWLKDLLEATSPLDIRPHRTKIAGWLEEIAASHQPLARMRSVTVVIDSSHAPPTARFDAKHLEHALVAILTNAIQASPANSTVTMTSREIAGGTVWEVAIRDQGPGIPPEISEKVFRPYFTTKADGTGIGLAVAQQVVKLHDGAISLETVTSGPNRGTTFFVRIPIVDSDSSVVDISH
jgi:signal transduction histidine kinase